MGPVLGHYQMAVAYFVSLLRSQPSRCLLHGLVKTSVMVTGRRVCRLDEGSMSGDHSTESLATWSHEGVFIAAPTDSK